MPVNTNTINSLEFAKIFMQALDQLMIDNATSGWMEANAGLVQYNGGDEVKIPKLSTTGLGDYDRDKGYKRGAVSLTYQTRKLTMERGTYFHLDPMDIDEANFIPTVTKVMSEFQRLQVVPEIDAYRYMTLANYALEAGQSTTYTPATSDVYQTIKNEIAQMTDTIGPGRQLVLVMNALAANILEQADKIERALQVDTFVSGTLNSKVNTIDGIPILRVSSRLMKTAYQFLDGESEGQKDGGFIEAAGAKQINWMLMARHVPIAISKTDVPRFFDPMTNQQANAWRVDYRKYHDIWVLDNQVDALWANIGA